MKGGKFICNRNKNNESRFSCVDYDNGIYNSINSDENGWIEYYDNNTKTRRKCNLITNEDSFLEKGYEISDQNNWVKYFDKNAQSNYWYNAKTREATWIEPQNKTGGKNKKSKTLKNKKSKTLKNKKSKTLKNKKSKKHKRIKQ